MLVSLSCNFMLTGKPNTRSTLDPFLLGGGQFRGQKGKCLWMRNPTVVGTQTPWLQGFIVSNTTTFIQSATALLQEISL